MLDPKVTIFESLYVSDKPYYVPLSAALKRIEVGKSLDKVAALRGIIDKEHKDAAKKNLPGVCFSGIFRSRNDKDIVEHNGFIVLDFDNVGLEYRQKLEANEYTYACWLSPSGTGFKVLVRIADGKRHREHFAHIRKHLYPECDSSGVNESRFCFESYDPEIYINKDCAVYTKIYTEQIYTYTEAKGSKEDIYTKLMKWMDSRGDAFVNGQRNQFIYRLASACCRFGVDEQECEQRIISEHLGRDGSFSHKEASRTIKSAYKRNTFGSAEFDQNYKLVERRSGKEVELTIDLDDVKSKDIIYSDDVKEGAFKIKNVGYTGAECTGMAGLDFKLKRGEITLLSGLGNAGKSSLLKYMMLCKSIKDGDKWCVFGPEDFPADEFYHDLVEMYEGEAINGHIPHYVSDERYNHTYDLIGKHFLYCYPQEDDHTPDYILQRFLETIIKEKVTGIVIDPFNQQYHDMSDNGYREDKYLERVFAKYTRFARENDIYFIIVAHPKIVSKLANGNYECPDVFDISGGAMWNNKMDNILIYHRPLMQTDPNNPLCEFHKKKIRRQKTVGRKGTVLMEYDPRRRRFEINGVDYLGEVIRAKHEGNNPYSGMPNTHTPF